MFHIGLHFLWFPIFFLYLPNLKAGWEKWYRIWNDQVTRFGGWLIMRRWYAEFKKDAFPRKLAAAKKILARSFPGPVETGLSNGLHLATEGTEEKTVRSGK
jgi:hypothetical protein